MMDDNNSMKIMSIVGARPNFMKVASIARAVDKCNVVKGHPKIVHTIVHTGQHYDEKMSDLFFNELEIPEPHYNLEVGSGSHALQTAQIMERFEPVLLTEQPDVLLVVGDVNSTIACALVATKIQYNGASSRKRPSIAHVEAGLRSLDRDMPEEINRILTDALSDLLFVTERDALVNLEHEGVSREKVHFVGNVMIDTLIRHKEKALRLNVIEKILHQNCDNPKLKEQLQSTRDRNGLSYGLITLHRPSNVDTPDSLRPLMQSINKISSKIPLIFPLHPRTKNNLKRFDLLPAVGQQGNIIYTEPLGYLEFLNLLINAALVLTDSGGIQEEATFLNIPCITLRHNTERPVTVAMGTNYLVGTDPNKIEQTAFAIIDGNRKSCTIPPLWDGMASERIMDILSKSISSDLGQCNVQR
jgi:UDP-N-acetylglucosamine 2-epimerase (non-hydrolysing)